MTNQDDDPHQDFRRQADQRFGRKPSPPRISRSQHPAAPAPTPAPAEPPQAQRLLDESTNRFGAGTTYGAPVAPIAPNIPAPPTPVPSTVPKVSGPPAPAPPSVSPPPPPPVLPIAAQYPGAGPGPASAAQGLDLQPSQAMWLLTGFCGLLALASGLGWILVVGGCAYGAWLLGQRRTPWPPDLEDLLVRARLTQPTTQRISTTPGPPQAPPAPYIPFRPLTAPELFVGAFKVVSRNWPTLVGIPLALLIAAVVAGGVLGFVMVQVLLASGDMLSAAGGLGSMMAFFVIFMLLVYVVALPIDAMLIALSVTATDKAVRGERIRLTPMLAIARKRMFAVVRLTVAFYGIILVANLLVYAIIGAVVMGASLALGIFFYIVFLVADFIVGLMLSLAPIVVITEDRGVMDSFKRSVQLVKSGLGRILATHLLWAVCIIPILAIPSLAISFALGTIGMFVFMVVSAAFLIAYTRTLQLLIYTDIRMREEQYDQELIADWARNTAAR